MQYRPLGNTDINVSAICLGTMTYGEQNTEAEGHRQIDVALHHGVNFLDTAEMYAVPASAETQGETERIIGSWIKNSGRREDIVLATKVAGPGNSYIRGGTAILDRANIEAAIDTSLKRLQTDYIDLYQVHWPERQANRFGKLGFPWPEDADTTTPIDETLEALGRAVDAGKVRAIGVSNETPWGVSRYLTAAAAANLPRIASIQNPYNLLNRTFEVGLAEFAYRESVGLLAYSPLGFGVLSGKFMDGAWPEGARLSLFHDKFPRYIQPKGRAATARYVDLARSHGLDPAQMALAFVTSRPFVTSNIIGARTEEQLLANLASAELTLSDEVEESINALHDADPNPCP